MHHFYKIFGDQAYEKRLTASFKEDRRSVTTKISTLVTFSPKFFEMNWKQGLVFWESRKVIAQTIVI